MRKLFYIIIFGILLSISANASAADIKTDSKKPDLEKIKAKTTDESSKFYYPRLYSKFMANDSTMTGEEFQYFYYGTMFQEDFDPYRKPYDEKRLKEITPLYYKQSHTREERDNMLKYAREAIAYNPLDLVQIKNMVYVYEKNGKVNLAQIWKYKLNHLLWVIASSGNGHDTDNAWVVAYPRHEFDFLNMMGLAVDAQEFVAPYYEKVAVRKLSDNEPDSYYFDIKEILDQYYLKHPSER